MPVAIATPSVLPTVMSTVTALLVNGTSRVSNAIFDATGVRLRWLPLVPNGLRV